MQFRPPSLRRSLILLVALAIVPCIAITLFLAKQQHDAARALVERDATQISRTAATSYALTFASIRESLITLAQLQSIRSGDWPRCSQTVRRLKASSQMINDVGAVAGAGVVVCSTEAAVLGSRFPDPDTITRARRSRIFTIGQTLSRAPDGGYAITLAWPVLKEGNQEADTVLFATVPVSALSSVVRWDSLPTGTQVLLVNRLGTVLSASPDAQALVAGSIATSAPYRAAISREGEGSGEMPGPDQQIRLYAYTRMPGTTDSSPLHVLVGIPPQVAFAQVDATFTTAIAGMLLVAALSLLAAWFFGNLLIVRQSRKLVEASVRIAQGDLKSRSGMSDASGELGAIARAFDHMGESIQSRQEQIDRAELEMRLLQNIVLAISEAPSLSEAFAVSLARVCEATGWALGQAWVMSDDGQSLLCQPGWYSRNPDLAPFHEISMGLSIKPRGELVGRAARLRQPVWLPRLGASRGYSRAEAAARMQLCTGIAFPITAGEKVVAVLEFYAYECQEEDPKLMSLVNAVATQVGAVIQRKQAEDIMAFRAYHDLLTGLPNLDWLSDNLGKILGRSGGDQTSFALIVIDLHGLKEINNTLGHANGDTVIQQIARRLNRQAEAIGAIAIRLSGNIFCLLWPSADEATAIRLAKRLISELDDPLQVSGVLVEVNVSCGIALYPRHGNNLAQIVQHADTALAMAHQAQSGYAVYLPEKDPYNPRRLSLLAEFRRALAEGHLKLYVQPKVTIRDRRVSGSEALVRWEHPEYGLLLPDEFIPIVENTGLIKPFAAWLIHESLHLAGELDRQGITLPIAINLSARNLLDENLPQVFQDQLAGYHLPASLLDVEVTESSVMRDHERSSGMLSRLNQIGFHLFIDDFGTGYSSLSYLTRLPFDALKIDQSFVRGMGQAQDARTVVEAIINLGRNLGMKVVAEGVADEMIWQQLEQLGCDEAQGYYISRPMPAGDFLAWLKTSGWDYPGKLCATAPRPEREDAPHQDTPRI